MPARARRARARSSFLLLVFLVASALSLAPPAKALVFASLDTEPITPQPPDFPYWDYVTQRRYEGPTVIYLGSGHALTARHVGMGEILLEDQIIEPISGSKRTLLNDNGSAADAMIFGVKPHPALDRFPVLPIAREPLRRGEEVYLVGFGKGRGKVIEFELEGVHRYGFTWSKKGEKRWGTNRIKSNSEIITQEKFRTRAVSFDFGAPNSDGSTAFEAQAAVGDSGGGVFVKRDGEWQLAAMMISISGRARNSDISTLYGDITYAVDLSYYRDQILRWTRPACSNELDDDGDEQVDHPNDPGCDDPWDTSERESGPLDRRLAKIATLSSLFVAAAAVGLLWSRRRRQRGVITANSTRPSSAA